jgi:O-antigen/teichoic acid export membrane protein
VSSFLRESLLTFGSRILLVLVNFPISILVFRHLGADGQSIYSSVTSYATSFVVIGLLGIDAAHTYFLAGGRARGPQIAGNSILVLAGLSLILIPLFGPLIAFAIRGQGNAVHGYLGIGMAMIPILAARYLLLSVFMARRRNEAFNLIYAGCDLLLLGLLLVGFLHFRGGATWALWAFVISQTVMVLVAGRWAWIREVRGQGPPRPSMPLFKASLSYGLRGFLATVLTTFVYRFDTVLVLRWLGTAAQGQYFVAVFLAEKLTHITTSIQAVLFPHVSAASSEEADRLTPRVCRHTLFWVTVSAAGLFAVSSPLMRTFYSDKAAACIAPMRILLPGIVALTLSKLLTSDLSGRDRRFVPTLFTGLSLAVNIALNYAWTRSMGIVGAAWASTVAYSLQALLGIAYFWQVTGVSPRRLLVPHPQDIEVYRGLLRRWRDRGARPEDGNHRGRPQAPGPREG